MPKQLDARPERGPGAAAWLCAAAALLLPSRPSHAAESEAVESPRARVTLVSEVDAVAPGERFRIGLHQKLAPHWHTYWKNPGDSGTPPSVELTLPEGATGGDIVWPGPQRLPAGPVLSFGYEHEVLLPLTVVVPDSARVGDTFEVLARADWLVCKEDCIPEQGEFRLALPIVAQDTPAPRRACAAAVAEAFARSDRRAPRALPGSARVAAEGESLSLRIEGLDLGEKPPRAFFFPDRWGVIEHAAPQSTATDLDGLSLAMKQAAAFDPNATVSGVLALGDGGNGTRYFRVPPTPPRSPAAKAATTTPSDAALVPTRKPPMPLWQTALFALLGGLLLNLMPCVFPVLALKARALVGLGRDDRREVRRDSLWYTAGVLVAFMSLAALLLLLRAGGSAVGWGFQFQSPIFVTAMAWLLLAVGLNLSGVYEVGLTLTGAGDSLADRSGHAGSFFTGLLAVVVATPCTAPFMGAALGAALLAPPLTCLALFVALGLGLALPYLALAAFPGLAARLPRPGAWMLRLQQALAFPMYATVAWLLWVLARQAGEAGLRVALTGCVLVGLAGWLYGVAQQAARGRWLARTLALGSLLAALTLVSTLETGAAASTPSDAVGAGVRDDASEAFSPARLAALREQGSPVFVNMTADWCLTCMVNERTALGTERVQQAMRQAGVTYLKGDWTRRDPDITAFLQRFEREGVPFYAVYPRGGASPEILPSVLTVDVVLEALGRAAQP